MNAIWEGTKNAGSLWLKFNEQAISDAKRLGMTSKAEAMDYTKNLIENAKELSRNFAMASDQAMKLQESYIKVTGRATMLSRSQMSDIAASSKIMGDETVQGAIKIMDSMGATSQTTVELLDKNYARAKNAGLDITKASEELVKNLSLANKLNFRSGVDGISKMTIYSQRIRMDLQQVANVAEKFSTIEGAIEGSARLQMLGGTAAMYGNNPMAMMYEAMADPEALFKRMGRMFSTQAYFDKKTGEARIDPVQQQLMREQAKALGMDPEQAIQSAKQQAKLRSIEGDIRTQNPSLFASMDENQRNAIANKAEYSKESGWTVTYYDNEKNEQVTAAVNKLTSEQLEKITKDNKEPIDDIRYRVREIAGELVGTKERTNSIVDQLKMSASLFLHPFMGAGDAAMTSINGSSAWGGLTSGGVLGGIGSIGASALINALQIYGMWGLGKGLWKHGKSLFGKGGSSETPTVKLIKYTDKLGRVRYRDQITGRYVKNPTKPLTQEEQLAKTSEVGKLGKLSRYGGTALAVGAGIYEGYSQWSDANADYNEKYALISQANSSNNYTINGRRYGSAEIRAMETAAKNRKSEAHSGAVGAGVGTTAGILAGGAAGAKIGGMIGTAIAPGVGSAVGAAIGGVIGGIGGAFYGSKYGKKVGRGLSSTEDDDIINKHLNEINKSDEEENFRKIVLPVESIDYNVSLIANQLGILSARPARGNVYLDAEAAGEHVVEAQEMNTIGVNKVDSNVIYSSQMYEPKGPLTLNINGSIDLNMRGSHIGNISASDFKKMFDSNPELQRQIVEVITNRQVRNGNAGRNNQERSSNRLSTTENTYTIGR